MFIEYVLCANHCNFGECWGVRTLNKAQNILAREMGTNNSIMQNGEKYDWNSEKNVLGK